MPGNVAFPYQFDATRPHRDDRRRLASARPDRAGADDRAGRAGEPSGLRQRRAALVFAPNSDTLAATVQFLIQSALQQLPGASLSLCRPCRSTPIDGTLTITSPTSTG